MAALTGSDMLGLRMVSLLLTRRERRTPAEVVSWFGAMQAQNLASGEWSIGVRCAGLTQAEVHQATVDRSIVRTWPMRGTVHFVPPRDAKWMLELTGVRAVAGARKRRADLGLTDSVVTRATEVLEAALRGGRALTRAECVTLLVDAGLHTAPEHGYHLLLYASQIGVTCIGPQRGKEQTFVLLDEWIPDPNHLSRDEALAQLAIRYFRSHGPTTPHDFAGWTGLTVSDAKRGVVLAGELLTTVDVEGTPMIIATALLDEVSRVRSAMPDDDLLLLPGFDEYLLGYKDRSAMITREAMKLVVPGNNGVFQPTIVDRGRVIGTWKHQVHRRDPIVVPQSFEPLTRRQHAALQRASRAYATYLGS